MAVLGAAAAAMGEQVKEGMIIPDVPRQCSRCPSASWTHRLEDPATVATARAHTYTTQFSYLLRDRRRGGEDGAALRRAWRR